MNLKKSIWAGLFLIFLFAPTLAHAQKVCTRASPTSQNCTVTVQWPASAVDATHDAPTNYVVEQSIGGSAKVQVGSVAADVTSLQISFSDAGNVAHCFDVYAVNSGGQSASSAAACWTTPAIQVLPPNPPGNLTTAALDSSRILAQWEDTNSDETSQRLDLTSSSPPFAKSYTVGPNITQFVIAGLRKNKTYSTVAYALRASSAFGQSEISAPSNTAWATTLK